MTFNFTVSPSFPNERISDWYIFNTWLQRNLSLPIHLELYDSFGAQRAAIADGKVDFIYANPFDASLLVRDKGFRAIARPDGRPDEMVIVSAADGPAGTIRDLQAGTRLACSDDPCVNTVGRILLEPANLDATNIVEQRRDNLRVVRRRHCPCARRAPWRVGRPRRFPQPIHPSPPAARPSSSSGRSASPRRGSRPSRSTCTPPSSGRPCSRPSGR